MLNIHCVCMYVNLCKPHACMHACMRACACACVCACVCMRACRRACVPACLRACVHERACGPQHADRAHDSARAHAFSTRTRAHARGHACMCIMAVCTLRGGR